MRGPELVGWAPASLSVENHSLTEAASWADEYKRILRLFENTLRAKTMKGTS
jgi:hypothetical protein